jgi:mRNA interferase MazF
VARILRGGVYWADLEPIRGHEQGGSRPVLILSQDLFNERAERAIAMAITCQPPRVGYPLIWPIPDNILPRRSWVLISQLRTLATERLGDRLLAQLSHAQLDEILEGLWQLMGS